jgi:hypothetical protein
VARTLEVLDLRIGQRKAAEILKARGIHADEIRAAVEDVGRLTFWWLPADDERPPRACVPVEIQDREALVILYPAENELGTVWRLGSAYFIDE